MTAWRAKTMINYFKNEAWLVVGFIVGLVLLLFLFGYYYKTIHAPIPGYMQCSNGSTKYYANGEYYPGKEFFVESATRRKVYFNKWQCLFFER
jgi:uncharacterized membrane protein